MGHATKEIHAQRVPEESMDTDLPAKDRVPSKGTLDQEEARRITTAFAQMR
jgi:hypothetical protein